MAGFVQKGEKLSQGEQLQPRNRRASTRQSLLLAVVMHKDHYAAHSCRSSVLSLRAATYRSYPLGASIGQSL